MRSKIRIVKDSDVKIHTIKAELCKRKDSDVDV